MKYILYKTTNLINSYIYIGVHKTTNPYIFDGYIGNGCYVNDNSKWQNPKTSFQLALKQFGIKNFKREVLSVYDTEDEAYTSEEMIVNENFLARDDVYNMVLGGKHSLYKTIKCYQYDLEGNLIREFDSMVSAALSVGVTVKAISRSIIFKNKCQNYYWNTDKVDRIDISAYNQPTKPVKVYRYLVNSGTFDKEYDSYTKAAQDTDCTLVQVIRSAKICYRVGNYQFLLVKASSYDKAKSIYLRERPVFKYDRNGNFLQEYLTQAEAELDNVGSNITVCIKNKKPCKNGFIWGLEKLDKYCSTKTKRKPIGMFDLKGNLIKTWDSVKSWKLEYPINTDYIKVGKTYKKQYIFKFI